MAERGEAFTDGAADGMSGDGEESPLAGDGSVWRAMGIKKHLAAAGGMEVDIGGGYGGAGESARQGETAAEGRRR